MSSQNNTEVLVNYKNNLDYLPAWPLEALEKI